MFFFTAFRQGLSIFPPDLKDFEQLIENIVEVMISENFKDITGKYINDISYEVPYSARRLIANYIMNQVYIKNFRNLCKKICKVLKDRRYYLTRTLLKRLSMHGNEIPNQNKSNVRPMRITSTEKDRKNLKMWEDKIFTGDESNFTILNFGRKGKGVVATKNFEKDEFLLEYSGDLMTYEEGRKKHEEYAKNHKIGSYIYDFKFQEKVYSVDATVDRGRLGRLVNHSCIRDNAKPKIVFLCNQPRIIFLAKRDIKVGDEILYDYGDRSQDSIRDHPWLLL